jgi:hypothetical protein
MTPINPGLGTQEPPQAPIGMKRISADPARETVTGADHGP